jgi:uncharacterized protein (TIGR03435 family)
MTLETLLAQPMPQSLGRALLHFLWQGSLLGSLLWIVRRITRPSAARVRYAAASLIMLMMPAVLIVTVQWDIRREPTSIASTARPRPAAPVAIPREGVVYDPPAVTPVAGIAGWFVCIWVSGVVLLSARSAGGWLRAQQLKHFSSPASSELEAMMRRLKRMLRVSAPVRVCTSALTQVPTVIGWIRPYILLPLTALTSLNESQIEAILAHELAHIRRYDYALNLLQTAIETMLFYHPAVWWVGKQMRVERENCCDDIAVAVCGSAFAYAQALAELEGVRSEDHRLAIAATGGDLLARIRRVLGQHDPSSPSLGIVAAAALALVITLTPTLVSLRAAPQEPPPAFEVASVKRDISGQPGPVYNMFPPQFRVERATLKSLIQMAYRVHDFQVLGGPGWSNSDRYNIEAKIPGNPVLNERYRTLQLRRLQTLLQDRFKLALHREMKELPIYELTVAKGGAKLDPPNCIQRNPGDPIAPGKTMTDYCGWGGWYPGRYEATTANMTDLAGGLSDLLERIVVDKTGITGMFHLHLTFTPDDSTIRLPDIPGAPPPPVDGPNIFTALQEQLGLKLEAAKGPVEVLVIDSVERPSEN